MDLSLRKSNNFDFIRFLAASLVIVTHMQNLMGLGGCDALCSLTNGSLTFSHLGVKVFFIISGYLIVKSLIQSKTYFGYLWKRALRIFPGLFIVLLSTIFILGPLTTTHPLTDYFSNSQTWQMLGTLSLFQLHLNLPGVFESNPLPSSTNGSLWTLVYEFSFYIILLFAGILGFIKRPTILLVLWIAVFGLRIFLGEKMFVYDYATPFLLGLNLLQVIENGLFFLSGSLFYLFRDNFNFDWKAALILTILMIASIAISSNAARLFYFIAFPYLVFYLAFLPSKLNSFGKYGDFSYGIYIYAFPVQQWLIYLLGLTLGVPIMSILSFLITLILAWLSWNFVEKKALFYKDLFK